MYGINVRDNGFGRHPNTGAEGHQSLMCIAVEVMRENDLGHELCQLMREIEDHSDNMGKANVFPVDDAADDCLVGSVGQ